MVITVRTGRVQQPSLQITDSGVICEDITFNQIR
jgi:hypothetical protein